MAYKHGVYINEAATAVIAPIETDSGLQMIFGTAPVNLTANPTANVNKPVICYSWAEAVAAFGYSDDWASYTLCQAMYACFKVFNVCPVIFVNVLDPANTDHKTAVASTAYSVVSRTAKVTVKGMIKSSVAVTDSTGATTYTLTDDYVLAYDTDGNLLVKLTADGDAAAATEIKVSGDKLNPAGVAAADIVGSVDAGTGAESGLETIRQVEPLYGKIPGILSAPGWSHNATVAAGLQAKTVNINGEYKAFCVLDISTENAMKYTQAKTEKEALGATSENALCVWPMAKVGTLKFYASALMSALLAYTDTQYGDVPIKSPSNLEIRATAACLSTGAEVLIDRDQANLLNENGICTLLRSGGAFKAWGNDTAAYPTTTDPKDRFISCRRFFSWWGNTFIKTYMQKVDDPANYKLIESIVDSENIRGNSFVARGYCAAARMTFSAEENPVTDILNGTIRFHQYIAPYTPAQVIENTLEFDTDALSAALTGE